MAEIDSNFPFNQIGLSRVPQGNDAETGALSNLRRAREERREREEEAQRTREAEDRVEVTRQGGEGETVPAAEQAVQREEPAASAPGQIIEDPEAADARTLSAIQQAIAAVVRRSEPLEPEPVEERTQSNIVEPGVEGPVGQLQLQPEALPANLLTPPPFEQPPQPENQQPAEAQNPPPAAANPVPNPAAQQADSNVEQLAQNPASLREDFLGTDPALRANRELRSFITEPGEGEPEPPPPAAADTNRLLNAEREPFVPPGAQPETVTPSVAEAVQAERVEEARAEQAEAAIQEARERREEEEEQTPPPPPNPEALVTERGFRINEII